MRSQVIEGIFPFPLVTFIESSVRIGLLITTNKPNPQAYVIMASGDVSVAKEPSAMNGSHPIQWATDQEWNDQQPRIIRLYKRMTLNEVIKIMEREYNFKAT